MVENSTVLGFCMVLHYAATLLLFGSALGRMMLATAERATITRIDERLRRVLCGAASLGAITALAMVPLQTRSMSGDWTSAINPDVLGTVMWDTAFGRAWGIHLMLSLVVCAVAFVCRPPAGRWLLILSTLLVAGLGSIGHATMEQGWVGILHPLNHAVHLLAAGSWLGGLIPLALLLAERRSGLSPREMAAALRRFSGYASAAVVIVLASGALNVAIIEGRLGKLAVSFYGGVLMVKLALVAVLVVLALANRYWFLPMMAKDAGAALRRLSWSIAAELAVGGLVLIVAVVLGMSAPP